MSDLKTLVENYFAPKPKTLTKQVLYEIFDEVMREQEEQPDPRKNFEVALDKIKQEGYEYEIVQGKNNVIKVKHDNRLEALETLLRNLEPLGFSHNIDSQVSSLGRIEIKDKVFGSAFIIIKPLRKTAALAGNEFEEAIANKINEKYSDLEITATTAGAGHGSDVTITGPKDSLTIETKTSLSADFGQFRVQYNTFESLWEPRRTPGYVKNEEIFEPLYENLLNNFLNQKCVFPNLEDPRLNKDKNGKIIGLRASRATGELKKELQNSWFGGKNDYKKDFDFKFIAPYYADKGDELIQLGRKGLYALTDKAAKEFNIPKFEDSGLNAFIRFRFKPTMGANSNTSFTVAIKIKGKLEKSPLSLTSDDDLDKIVNKLS